MLQDLRQVVLQVWTLLDRFFEAMLTCQDKLWALPFSKPDSVYSTYTLLLCQLGNMTKQYRDKKAVTFWDLWSYSSLGHPLLRCTYWLQSLWHLLYAWKQLKQIQAQNMYAWQCLSLKWQYHPFCQWALQIGGKWRSIVVVFIRQNSKLHQCCSQTWVAWTKRKTAQTWAESSNRFIKFGIWGSSCNHGAQKLQSKSQSVRTNPEDYLSSSISCQMGIVWLSQSLG